MRLKKLKRVCKWKEYWRRIFSSELEDCKSYCNRLEEREFELCEKIAGLQRELEKLKNDKAKVIYIKVDGNNVMDRPILPQIIV